jgi:hypothetical protein
LSHELAITSVEFVTYTTALTEVTIARLKGALLKNNVYFKTILGSLSRVISETMSRRLSKHGFTNVDVCCSDC